MTMNDDFSKNYLQTDLNKGLDTEEAEKRLNKFGDNSLDEKKESAWKKIFYLFWSPIPWMIEIAAVLSLLLQRWPDFILIMTLLIVNSLLEFWQEFTAGNAIAALKNKLALNTGSRRLCVEG